MGQEEDIDDEQWNDIVKDVDVNGDGEVDFKEFLMMMRTR
jgi:Ca2+-binding EF-hand superfamily protein